MARGQGNYRDATINLLDPSLSQVVGSIILHGVKPVKWSHSQVLGATGRESVEVSVGQVELKLHEQCDLEAWVAQNNAGMLAPKSCRSHSKCNPRRSTVMGCSSARDGC